ncbi:MAG: hypothetical protein ABIB79_02780 [archaeon]
MTRTIRKILEETVSLEKKYQEVKKDNARLQYDSELASICEIKEAPKKTKKEEMQRLERRIITNLGSLKNKVQSVPLKAEVEVLKKEGENRLNLYLPLIEDDPYQGNNRDGRITSAVFRMRLHPNTFGYLSRDIGELSKRQKKGKDIKNFRVQKPSGYNDEDLLGGPRGDCSGVDSWSLIKYLEGGLVRGKRRSNLAGECYVETEDEDLVGDSEKSRRVVFPLSKYKYYSGFSGGHDYSQRIKDEDLTSLVRSVKAGLNNLRIKSSFKIIE